MRLLRAFAVVALLLVAAFVGYRLFSHRSVAPSGSIAVYYVKTDARSLARWSVSLGSARDLASVALYAAVQAVAGPAPGVDAIRFPAGTIVRSVRVAKSTATVDLGGNVANAGGGSLTEDGEFKALVWTLTALPGITSVQVLVDGLHVPTLPGGHFELDQPLTRQDW